MQHKSSLELFIPEPCRASDKTGVGQGSGKEPDNDGVWNALHHHNNDQLSETGEASTEYPYPV